MIVRKTKADNIEEALKIVSSCGCDKYVYNKLAKKLVESIIIVDDIDNRAANILKQESLSCGADAAVNVNVSKFERGVSRTIICATANQLEKLVSKIKEQPFGLKELAKKISDINKPEKKRIITCCKKKVFLKEKALVMGIVNLSPDSFFGNGINEANVAAHLAQDMEECGADIIDVGAESTRPGSKPISAKDEILRITKFLKIFIKKTKLPVSVDTYKPEVAKAALNEGADIINDIYALRYDKAKMAEVIAKYKAGIVLMHMRGTPLTMQKNIKYEDIMLDIFKFLSERIDFALQNGIKKESLIVDPGIGFGKTVDDNLLIIKKLTEFKTLDCPLLIGISNKSFLAKVANVAELKERLIASVTACVMAAANGADIIRVHNVAETMQALRVVNAVRRI